MDKSKSLALLDYVIESLKNNLENYQSRKGPNSRIVNHYKKLIRILHDLKKSFLQLGNDEGIELLKKTILQLEKKDPQISTFFIFLRRRKGGSKTPGRIHIDFDDE